MFLFIYLFIYFSGVQVTTLGMFFTRGINSHKEKFAFYQQKNNYILLKGEQPHKNLKILKKKIFFSWFYAEFIQD